MSGFQFIRLESYARVGAKQTLLKPGAPEIIRKWSLRDVEAEALREPGACPHVKAPLPPTLVYGFPLNETMASATEWASQARDALGRKLRKDGLCLVAGVVSLPVSRAGDWPAFRYDVVQWLQHRYGERLRTVLEHHDEANPHLHFYVVPQLWEDFDSLHPGRAAARFAKSDGQLKGSQNRAYSRAMRNFQDEFWLEMASGHGLARVGPGRRRLSRSAWHSEQEQVELMATALAEAKNSAARVVAGLNLDQIARDAAEPVLAEAKRQYDVALQARREAVELKQEAERYRQRAQSLATQHARTEIELRRLARSELLRVAQGIACLLAAEVGRMNDYWEMAEQGFPEDGPEWRQAVEELACENDRRLASQADPSF